jgi:hypothetical protein
MSERIVRRRPVDEEEDKRDDSDNEAPNRRQRTEGEFDGDATTEESESNPHAGWSPLEKHYERLQQVYDPNEKRLLCFEEDPDEWRMMLCFPCEDEDSAKRRTQEMHPAHRLDCYLQRLKKRGVRNGSITWSVYIRLLDDIRTALVSPLVNTHKWLLARQTSPSAKPPKEFSVIEELLKSVYFIGDNLNELKELDKVHSKICIQLDLCKRYFVVPVFLARENMGDSTQKHQELLDLCGEVWQAQMEYVFCLRQRELPVSDAFFDLFDKVRMARLDLMRMVNENPLMLWACESWGQTYSGGYGNAWANALDVVSRSL